MKITFSKKQNIFFITAFLLIFIGMLPIKKESSSVMPTTNSITEIKLNWIAATEKGVLTTPTISKELIYVGSRNRNIYCIDIHNREIIWKKNLQKSIEAPALVLENKVIIGTTGGVLYCLDSNSEILWEYKTKNKIVSAANYFRDPINQQLRILVGSYDNCLHCIDFIHGNMIWKYETENYINSTPIIHNNTAIFGGCDMILHIVNLANGESISKIPIGAYIAASPVILNSQAFLGTYNNSVFAIDLEKQSILWEYHTESKDTSFCSSPVVFKNYILLGSSNRRLYCLNKINGKKIWEFKSPSNIDNSPAILKNTAIMGTDGRIYGIDIYSGKKLWNYEIGGTISGSPIIYHNNIILATDEGKIYMLKTN